MEPVALCYLYIYFKVPVLSLYISLCVHNSIQGHMVPIGFPFRNEEMKEMYVNVPKKKE